jgi:hypothetical protein
MNLTGKTIIFLSSIQSFFAFLLFLPFWRFDLLKASIVWHNLLAASPLLGDLKLIKLIKLIFFRLTFWGTGKPRPKPHKVPADLGFILVTSNCSGWPPELLVDLLFILAGSAFSGWPQIAARHRLAKLLKSV